MKRASVFFLAIMTGLLITSCSSEKSSTKQEVLHNYLLRLLIADYEGCYDFMIESVENTKTREEVVSVLQNKFDRINQECGDMVSNEIIGFDEDGEKYDEASVMLTFERCQETIKVHMEMVENNWYITYRK